MTSTSLRSRTISLAAAAALLCLAAAAAAQERFTPHHVAKIRAVTSVAVSPDGRHAAYILNVPRIPFQDDDGPAWEELHVISRDGQGRSFVAGPVNIGGVKWLPDGRGILYLAKRQPDETRAVHVIPLAGGETRSFLKFATDIVSFDVSRDGRRIAFLARPAPVKARQDAAKRGFNQEIYEESLQPQELFVADIKGGAVDATPRRVELPGQPSSVSWSPDGSKLAIVHAPTPLVDDDLMGKRVWIVDAASRTVTAKIENPGKLGQVAWSPDGTTIAMVSAADVSDPSEGRLMVVPATGGALKDVLPDYDAHVRQIAWKDANTIVYSAEEGVWSAIGEVRRDGTGRVTRVAKGGPIVSALDVAKDGTLAAVGDTPQHPGEVFWLAPGASQLARATTSNPWLKDMRFAKQEVVTFKARDGLALEGILVRPLDEQPGRRYPLILTVHGGPEARDAQGWRTNYSNPGQVGAAEGFAVFYPNYRGSTGRGVEFAKMGHGDPAGKEFDDLIDAVDHLITTGLVDRAKVGITGGSYGGYASAWGATYYSDRFAAAVAFVGISDKVSKLGTTDIANEEYLVHARKHPWDNWMFALERSPIFYADRSKTPTLILGGKDDPRVHPSQSLELYRHLKLRGKAPVRLVWYPGEGHGNRRAASRLDYHLRLMRWMTHYLKGPGGAPPPIDIDYRATTSVTDRR